MTDAPDVPPQRRQFALFALAFVLTPALWALLTYAMISGGTYLARFGQVAGMGLFFSLPAWALAFSWLAWKAAARERGGRGFVMASLGANLITFPLWFIGVMAAPTFGLDLEAVITETQARILAENPSAGPPPSVGAMAALVGAVAFFMGLFFLPMLAAIFAPVGRLLKAF